MPNRSSHAWTRPLLPLAALTLIAVFIVWAGRAVMPWDQMFPDFVCYWATGKIVASGQSPYDIDLQSRVQQEYGWDKATSGFGLLSCLPYYYPPWLAFVCVLLVPLGYEAAKVAWFFLNVELALLSGYLLRDAGTGVPRWIPVVLVPVFALTVVGVLLGQTSLLILFLMALSWKLLEQRWDRSAGAVLVWLTHKPQLGGVLLAAILLWAVVQRRWGIWQGFLAALVLLSAASSWLIPGWPYQMWEATRQTPPPTDYYPWIGNTWLLVLRALGVGGWALWGLYLAVALPFLAAVLHAALVRGRPVADLFALGTLAVFFVAPYARHYDCPLLLIPFLILLGGRLSPRVGTALLAALVVLPYVQIVLLVRLKEWCNPDGRFLLESTFFWIPVLLAIAWFATEVGSKNLAAPLATLAGVGKT
jgi:Glycosyltransferase family 87